MENTKIHFDNRRYGRLLAKTLPKVIDTELGNEQAIALVASLLDKGETATPEERALANLLVVLIEAFEASRYRLGASTPLSRLKMLMLEHGLRQADLLDVFGSRSTASRVLSGKRRISLTHAERLGARFGLPAAAFLEQWRG